MNREPKTYFQFKQLEAALEESEAFRRDLFHRTPIAVAEISPEGHFLEVNAAFCQFVGHSQSELLESDFNAITHPEDREISRQNFAKLMAGEVKQYTLEKRYRHRDGHWVYGIVTCYLRFDLAGHPRSAIAQVIDITERKRSEEEIRQKEEYLRLLLDNIPQQVFWKDMNLVFRGCNQKWAEAAGLESSEAVVGKTDFDLFGDRSIAEFYREKDRQVLESRTAEMNRVAPKQKPGPGGRRIWLDVSRIPLVKSDGEVLGVLGVLEDITERKEIDEKLRLTQFSIDKSRDYVLFSDIEARFFYANEAAGQILGYSKAELLKMEVRDIDPIAPPGGWPIAWDDLRREGSFTFESEHYTRSGEAIAVEITLSHLEYNNREYGCAVVRDIRDRKQAEIALQQAKETAETASRAKSEFLARMSHELRTPLNAILGFTQLMERELSHHSETTLRDHREHLEIIGRSGEHLLDLINDVLEMSKIEAGRISLNPGNFDFRMLLNGIREMLELKARSKGLTLNFEIADDIPNHLCADESKLRQALINLLGNAIKFTEVGGVTLRVKLGQLDASKLQLWLEVEDTGPGISPREMDLLFEPFAQTETGRKSQQGTGLGLSITRQFVRLMGGEMQVKSELGRGTIFRFDIQAEVAESTAEKPEIATGRAIALAENQPDYRILIVDDNWTNRKLVVKLLKPLGFQIREAENGREAIAIWEEWEPHLIFMDMRMPVMDGYEATQFIKRHLKGQATVIVALTASALQQEKSIVLSAGCDDFVRKPFRVERLFETMAKHLGVRFIYEKTAANHGKNGPITPSQTPPINYTDPSDLTPDSLAVMPPSWIAELNQAATKLNGKLIADAIAKIPPHHESLARMLARLAADFRYDIIIDLTRNSK
ncbi:PAS domain S-box protein [Lyngbya sp. CCY1209]|uniref:PAS domain S-box protein n=1 Tax=Lyngbya sp. CCY1209 TaxID=2886103 RepID=UPI002D209650|nr:PAS domain S-box protein [Lyngbya sp. CCY1209]MEB3885035.1 PAS domain S-box protein [Lyngbya sp. CCY1209]